MDERLSKTLDHPYRPTPARRRTLSNRPVAKARGQSNKIADRTTQMTPAFSCQQFSETIEIQEDIYENLNGRGRLLHASSCQQISRTKKIMSHNDWVSSKICMCRWSYLPLKDGHRERTTP